MTIKNFFHSQLSAKAWCIWVVAATSVIIGGAALLSYTVDPHYRYRLPFFYKTVYYEIYATAPRLLRDNQYDLLMLGSSMCRNYFLNDINKAFNCTSLKLAAPGATSFDLKKFSEIAINSKGDQLKNIVYMFDVYALNKTRPNYLDFDYMYKEDHWDDYKYLFSRDTFSSMIYLEKRARRPKGKRKYQTDKNRMFSTEHDKSVYGMPKVIVSAKSNLISHHTQKPYCKQSHETLRTELLQLIDKNPQIKFTVILPPYHIYSYCLSEYFNEADALIKQKSSVLTELLKRSNVTVHDFQSDPEIVCNGNFYNDIQHFSSKLARKVLASVAAGSHRLKSAADIEKSENALRQLIQNNMPQFRLDTGVKK